MNASGLNPVTSHAGDLAGRYLVDFGDQTATGLTAREVAALLESERYQHIKVYKIHRACPDGRMELAGVPNSRFHLEECFLFYRRRAEDARADFEVLRAAAERTSPPCRARVHLAKMPDASPAYLVAMLYPAEYCDEMSAWLTRIGYRGGDVVEGGASQAAGYLACRDVLVIDRLQLWGTQDGTLADQLIQVSVPQRSAAS